MNERFELKKTEQYYTHSPEDAIRVLEGSVYLYIVPWSEETGKAGKRVAFCEVEAEHSIPSFAWKDGSYRQWRFLIIAKTDHVQLEIIPRGATLILKKRFLAGANIQTFDVEGYEGSLVEYYINNELKDDIFLQRAERNAPEDRQKTFTAIGQAVGGDQNGAFGLGDQADLMYATLAFACKKAKIDLLSKDKLETICSEMTFPEMAQASQLICREVVLDVNWQKFDCGVLIVSVEEHPMVCYPRGGKYRVFDQATGKDVPLTKKLLGQINPKAWSIRRTLPRQSLKRKDIIGFVKKSFYRRDVISLIVLGLITTLIGVLQPKLNQLIYDDYIPMGDTNVLIQVCAVIATCMIGNVFISIVKQLQEYRLPSRVEYELQDAVYWRLFQLPESFFRKYDSADLAQRAMDVGQQANKIATLLVSNALTLALSLIYFIQMFKYSWKLALVGLLMIAVLSLIVFLMTKRTMKYETVIREENGEATGKLYQYLEGVDKIRMAGAEEKAILEYTLPVARAKRVMVQENHISSFTSILIDAGPTIFSMVLYFMMIKSKIDLSVGSFMAFNTAFSSFNAAALGFVGAAISYLQLKPGLKRSAPILETAVEDEGEKDVIETLDGDILVDHVTFGYSEDRLVLKDMSLHIHKGEYVALVGASGCGKSTLLKLLLGFEKPRSGRILYSGKDMSSIDKHSLRKNIGVVLQNGKLISGSIYDNITITANKPTMQTVQSVIEDVGLKEDIAAMPMGLHTVVNESGGTISGGQQQRILIARAIMSNPAVLYFDEATSALDNLTQAKVCESLEKRNMTRLVIAHRLSTVEKCDRIIVLDQGRVVEEGNYEQLMAQHGLFYQMAIRQIAE
ncbi:MAG: NHLP bacteriocin export ABC transporter permease/ATPase subunit [Clostridia bacterium]|nr:NHLP bacteriocin export ABC transporter permease/ATPase subunit [Clostridia bacterium]